MLPPTPPKETPAPLFIYCDNYADMIKKISAMTLSNDPSFDAKKIISVASQPHSPTSRPKNEWTHIRFYITMSKLVLPYDTWYLPTDFTDDKIC